MNANLHFEGSIAVLLVNWEICISDEGDLLIWSLGTEDVSQGYILKPLGLPNIVVVWLCVVSFKCYEVVYKAYNIDSGRDTGACE